MLKRLNGKRLLAAAAERNIRVHVHARKSLMFIGYSQHQRAYLSGWIHTLQASAEHKRGKGVFREGAM